MLPRDLVAKGVSDHKVLLLALDHRQLIPHTYGCICASGR